MNLLKKSRAKSNSTKQKRILAKTDIATLLCFLKPLFSACSQNKEVSQYFLEGITSFFQLLKTYLRNNTWGNHKHFENNSKTCCLLGWTQKLWLRAFTRKGNVIFFRKLYWESLWNINISKNPATSYAEKIKITRFLKINSFKVFLNLGMYFKQHVLLI